jgi:hypothetical protein
VYLENGVEFQALIPAGANPTRGGQDMQFGIAETDIKIFAE